MELNLDIHSKNKILKILSEEYNHHFEMLTSK